MADKDRRAQDLEDTAEEMLIAATEDGFVAAFAPEWGFERADDGWLVGVAYSDDGEIQHRYRIDITITEEV